MSVPHDDNVSGVVGRCLPQGVSTTGARDPAMGVHVVLGHAQRTIAVEIGRNRLAGIWEREEDQEKDGRTSNYDSICQLIIQQ